MLQPYKAFCHAFCESLRHFVATLLYAKNAPIPRIVAAQRRSGQALKVKPMLGGRAFARKGIMKYLIDPIFQADMVFFNGNGINTAWHFNYSVAEIEKFYKYYRENYGIGFRFPLAFENTRLLIYLHYLESIGFDLTDLCKEVIKSQENNYESYYHSLSLAKICFHYKKVEVDISIIPTNKREKCSDLVINNIKVDLKVRHDNTKNRCKFGIFDSVSEEERAEDYFSAIRSPEEDLLQAISSRAEKGFMQAQAIIFDLSSHFHSWNYHRLSSIENMKLEYIKDIPIIPSIGDIIVFSPNNTNVLETEKYEPKAKWILVGKRKFA